MTWLRLLCCHEFITWDTVSFSTLLHHRNTLNLFLTNPLFIDRHMVKPIPDLALTTHTWGKTFVGPGGTRGKTETHISAGNWKLSWPKSRSNIYIHSIHLKIKRALSQDGAGSRAPIYFCLLGPHRATSIRTEFGNLLPTDKSTQEEEKSADFFFFPFSTWNFFRKREEESVTSERFRKKAICGNVINWFLTAKLSLVQCQQRKFNWKVKNHGAEEVYSSLTLPGVRDAGHFSPRQKSTMRENLLKIIY